MRLTLIYHFSVFVKIGHIYSVSYFWARVNFVIQENFVRHRRNREDVSVVLLSYSPYDTFSDLNNTFVTFGYPYLFETYFIFVRKFSIVFL